MGLVRPKAGELKEKPGRWGPVFVAVFAALLFFEFGAFNQRADVANIVLVAD